MNCLDVAARVWLGFLAVVALIAVGFIVFDIYENAGDYWYQYGPAIVVMGFALLMGLSFYLTLWSCDRLDKETDDSKI